MLLGYALEEYRQVDVPDTTREQGFYVVGRRGMGKSTFLEALIAQDIYNGAGVGVFDPHGTLVEAVLNRIPESRINDVVYLDASDTEYAFGLNLFAATGELARAVDGVVQAFKKVWGVGEDASWGPLLEDLLSNITHTLMESQGYTLAEIPALLYKPEFRQRLTQGLSNWVVRDFWEYDWNPLTNRQQIQDRRSTTNKVRAFLRDPVLLHVLGQVETTVDFRAVMDESKILLVKLPLGQIGETAVSLLGSLMIGQILTAAMSREADQATPMFYLYADEFQRFATPAFATLIDETRKYRVATTIAHQRLNQLDYTYRSAALGSVNFALFQLTGDDASEFAIQFDAQVTEAPPDPNQWEQVKRGMHPDPAIAEYLGELDLALRRVKNIANWISGARADLGDVVFFTDRIDYRAVGEVMDWLDERITLFFARALPAPDNQAGMLDSLAVLAELAVRLKNLWQLENGYQVLSGTVEKGRAKRDGRIEMIEYILRPALGKLAVELRKAPIRTGNPRTVADTRAELANNLATLAPYTIAVRFWDGHAYQQGIVRLPPFLPAVDNPDKAARIQELSRQRYCRPRSDVEQEIRARRESLDHEPNEPEPLLDELPGLRIRD